MALADVILLADVMVRRAESRVRAVHRLDSISWRQGVPAEFGVDLVMTMNLGAPGAGVRAGGEPS